MHNNININPFETNNIYTNKKPKTMRGNQSYGLSFGVNENGGYDFYQLSAHKKEESFWEKWKNVIIAGTVTVGAVVLGVVGYNKGWFGKIKKWFGKTETKAVKEAPKAAEKGTKVVQDKISKHLETLKLGNLGIGDKTLTDLLKPNNKTVTEKQFVAVAKEIKKKGNLTDNVKKAAVAVLERLRKNLNTNSLNRDKKINGFDTTQEIKDVRVLDEIIKEPQVETEPTSVSEPEAQEITYDGLCEMIKSSSLPNETKNNLKNSLNSEYINVENIPDIISAVKAETLKEKHEHNLVCSLLKFLINKGIDSNQIFRFKDLIDHLIKNSVLTPNDHSIVFDALNILGKNSDTQSWRLAAIAIEKKLLTGEEQRTYCTTTVESIMGSNNFQSSILKMLFFNGSQERINLKNNILSSIINHEKLSDQQLRCIVQQVDKVILEAIDNDAINDISNFIAKDGILTKLLDRINDKKPKDTAIINNFANILYNIMLWMTTKKDEYSDDIGSLKESLKDLLLTFKPTLESYNSRACGMTMSDETQDPLWTYVLAMEAQNIGIDMSQSVEEPPVEAKSTSVSEAEAQGITYDALCEMVESSSLPNNLKDSLNRESINVKDIKEIISAFAPETLKEEHNLMCSLLKFLMNKVIDAGQRLEFRGLIKTLIDKEVLQKQDHNLVYESLVDISNQIQSTDSSVIIKIANSAIQQSILNQEECVGIISNSVMNAKFYDRIIANIASQNTILSHVIAKNVIQQISPEKLYNVISTVGDNLKNINDIRNTDKKASVTNWFVTEFLPTLLQRIQTLVANNSVNEEVKKNILFQFSCLFDGAILNNLFAQNKSAAAKLFNSLVPYLNQYQLNASQTQSWIDHLKEEAEKYGITLQETV